MNASGPKERATFSIAADVKSKLEAVVPKNERSRFVEKAIDQALRDVAIRNLQKTLDEIRRPATAEESGSEFLRRKRMEWDGRPIDVLEGRHE
ncbi:hypothetical protein [Kumtagia ephedrae]|jgi:hypothetical protein|uniref:CopG family transcriptional regulator n=1 Tax=Kumtagia ephedrae TaxID=2116701 RepID=A0A2P7S5H2_9HYPH|nr:hypothetical protein [Mesorhizobium ephedrae]PSJ57726.1 hypothetical protein C7I84_17005 [Mesorhizobium ephedrae]